MGRPPSYFGEDENCSEEEMRRRRAAKSRLIKIDYAHHRFFTSHLFSLIRGIEKATREYPLPVNPPFPVIDEDSLIADLFDISPRNFKGFSFYETRTQGRFGRRDGQGSLLNDDVSVGIELPESLLSSFGDEDVRINLLLYNSSDLFQDLQLPAGRVENNTKVVGCFVNNVSLENLQDPVKMIFTSFQVQYKMTSKSSNN